MRSRQHASPRRRSAAEWARLVKEFHESGQSPEAFAASRGVPLTRLRWWTWHLGGKRRPRSTKSDEMRLLPVIVEPMPAPTKPGASAAPAWEVCTADGDVLRVYGAMAPAEIQAALTALAQRGGRR
jgi:hypothetical protein